MVDDDDSEELELDDELDELDDEELDDEELDDEELDDDELDDEDDDDCCGAAARSSLMWLPLRPPFFFLPCPSSSLDPFFPLPLPSLPLPSSSFLGFLGHF